MAQLFEPIADAIVLSLAPRKVFDAGCAAGCLAEKLWDRGVETHGRDISELAISQVRADVRPWCEVGSIAEPIEGIYDLVLCIEVLEHMPTEEALASIRNLTAIAPRILFSASPTDREGVTCVNVRPIRYWLERFAEAGFAPTLGFDATSLSPHAFLLNGRKKVAMIVHLQPSQKSSGSASRSQRCGGPRSRPGRSP